MKSLVYSLLFLSLAAQADISCLKEGDYLGEGTLVSEGVTKNFHVEAKINCSQISEERFYDEFKEWALYEFKFVGFGKFYQTAYNTTYGAGECDDSYFCKMWWNNGVIFSETELKFTDKTLTKKETTIRLDSKSSSISNVTLTKQN
jgi:hypothetical protein